MDDNEIFSSVRAFAEENSEKDDIHGFSHVERVNNSCGSKLKANLRVLKIAALLHDTGRIKEDTDPQKRNHADISAEMAQEFLNSKIYNLPQNKSKGFILEISSSENSVISLRFLFQLRNLPSSSNK